MERVKGIEPSSQAWEARILPLDHTRSRSGFFYRPARRPLQLPIFWWHRFPLQTIPLPQPESRCHDF